MPDNRTVLMGDDATNSGYFVFVADKEKDLSAGTLYVAKVGTASPSTQPLQPHADLDQAGLTPPAPRSKLANTAQATDIMTCLPLTPRMPATPKSSPMARSSGSS
jgi:hypothetical protein